MSKVPTWKNVSAPNFNGANYLLSNANDLQSDAITGFGEAWNDIYETGRAGNDDRVLAEIAQMQDYDTFNQDKANLLSGLDMSRVSGDAITEALRQQQSDVMTTDDFDFERKYRQQLMDLNIAGKQASIAASNRSGRGGGGGRGRIGKHDETEADALYTVLRQQHKDAAAASGEEFDEFAFQEDFMDKGAKIGIPSLQRKYTLQNNDVLNEIRRDVFGKAAKKKAAEKDKLRSKWAVPTGANAEDSSWFAPLTTDERAAIIKNNRIDELLDLGYGDKELGELDALERTWITGAVDPTAGAADSYFNSLVEKKKAEGAGISDDDPVVRQLLSK